MASASKRPLEIDDLYNIKMVSDPSVSPDGKRVVWVETRLDQDDDAYKALLRLANVDGSNSRQLSSGQFRDTGPVWSPDGGEIAFVSNRPASVEAPDEDGDRRSVKDSTKVSQVWLIAADGGEARQLTAHPYGASEPCWSPDGRKMAFTAADDVDPDDLFDAPITSGVYADEIAVNDLRYRFNGKGFLKTWSHIWTIDIESRDAVRVTNGADNDQSPAWSPDGRQIAFVGNRSSEEHKRPATSIQVVSATGGDVRTVATEDASFGSPVWSPDGKTIAFIGHEDASTGLTRNNAVWTVAVSGKKLRNHTKKIDISFTDVGMSDISTGGSARPIWVDATTLLVSGSERGATSIYRVPIGKGKPEALTSDALRVLQYDAVAKGKIIVSVVGEPDRPFRLCSSTINGKRLKTVADPNEQLIEQVHVANPMELDAVATDGSPVQTWLLPPYGLKPDAGVTYPLIVQIHGGPHGMYGRAMFHEMQVMASRGYGVLFCNPRGSAGYGEAFTGITKSTWGESDMPDVIASVDEAAKLDWVDSDRLGITGGSYGGYLTNWIISHDTRFKAAVTQRCVSNFHSFVGTSDIGTDFGIYEFGGTPWGDAEKLLKYSPISYVEAIETPLLIVHSEQDLRCPIEQAEQLFTALRYLGKDVAFVRIPEESHELSRSGTPSRRIARLRHIIGWFDSHL